MARRPLTEPAFSENRVINSKYIVSSVLGKGAASVVYNGYYYVNEKPIPVIIKECYPYNADIERAQDGKLIWSGKNGARFLAVQRFKETYDRLCDIRNGMGYAGADFSGVTKDYAAGLTNTGSFPIDFVEYNNTAYIITGWQAGVTLDKRSLSLKDTLRVFWLLSNLAGLYHKCGLLHLDIKPQNIQINEVPEPGLQIVLFDIDSVVLKSSLRRDSLISFTKGYSAPELLSSNPELIDERADVYSIGVCLFERIMARMPETYDQNYYADWNEKEFKCGQISQPARKLVKKIFRKTLACDRNNRYSDTEELSADIKEVLQIVYCDQATVTQMQKALDSKIKKTEDYFRLTMQEEIEKLRRDMKKLAAGPDCTEHIPDTGQPCKTEAYMDTVTAKESKFHAFPNENTPRSIAGIPGRKMAYGFADVTGACLQAPVNTLPHADANSSTAGAQGLPADNVFQDAGNFYSGAAGTQDLSSGAGPEGMYIERGGRTYKSLRNIIKTDMIPIIIFIMMFALGIYIMGSYKLAFGDVYIKCINLPVLLLLGGYLLLAALPDILGIIDYFRALRQYRRNERQKSSLSAIEKENIAKYGTAGKEVKQQAGKVDINRTHVWFHIMCNITAAGTGFGMCLYCRALGHDALPFPEWCTLILVIAAVFVAFYYNFRQQRQEIILEQNSKGQNPDNFSLTNIHEFFNTIFLIVGTSLVCISAAYMIADAFIYRPQVLRWEFALILPLAMLFVFWSSCSDSADTFAENGSMNYGTLPLGMALATIFVLILCFTPSLWWAVSIGEAIGIIIFWFLSARKKTKSQKSQKHMGFSRSLNLGTAVASVMIIAVVVILLLVK